MKNEQFTPDIIYTVKEAFGRYEGNDFIVNDEMMEFIETIKIPSVYKAAPDMYEALKELHDWLMTQPAKFENEPRVKQAKVALLKAVKI